MLRISNHHISKVVVALLLVETVVLVGSVYVGAMIRFYAEHAAITNQFDHFFLSAFTFAIVIVLSMSALGMYQANYREGFRNTFLRLMPSLLIGFALMTLVFYMLPELYFGRGILGIVLLVAATGILLTRVLVYQSSESGLLRTRILFVGSGSLAKECNDLIRNNIAYHKYRVVGFLPVADDESHIPDARLLNNEESLLSLAQRHEASEILVAVRERRGGQFPVDELLECKLNGIHVTDAAAFFEREACQLRVDSLQPSWLIFGGGFDQSMARVAGKRAFDIIASTVLFIVALPLMLLTAVAIFIEDRGPIFYRQERIGKNGVSYMVLKFRSMRNNAEQAGQPVWALSNDPRTTRVGSFIRQARIDEIPQILNVLKGEMSFVGPRPERPYFVQKLCKEIPYYNMRHSVKPGITGMAQVRYQYGASVEDAVQKLQYDLYYVKNNSLFLDILILIDTLQVVLLGKGAR